MKAEPVFEECITQVGLARREAYKVKQAVEKVEHQERREILIRLADELFSKLDEIDAQLKR